MTSRAYETSVVSTIGARVRGLVLGIVMLASLAVNLVFAVATLNNPFSAYALCAFGGILAIIGWLVHYTVVDIEEVAEVVLTNIHPALLRAPVCIAYEWYVGTWLAWWFVTQLFYQCGIVYEHTMVGTIILAPLVLVTLLVRVFATSLVINPKLESWMLIFTQITTYTLLFFPSPNWAPQYNSTPMIALRILLYTLASIQLDFLEPPQWDISLDEPLRLRDSEVNVHNFLKDSIKQELGNSTQQMARLAKAQAILSAHAHVNHENRRMKTFATLTTWILVLPIVVVGAIYPVFVVLSIYDAAKNTRRRALVVSQAQPSVAIPLQPTPPLTTQPVIESQAESSASKRIVRATGVTTGTVVVAKPSATVVTTRH
jgi:hypothetical protein